MPDFICRIRIRPKYVSHGRMPEEFRDVRVTAADALSAQFLAIDRVKAGEPEGSMVSGHGAERAMDVDAVSVPRDNAPVEGFRLPDPLAGKVVEVTAAQHFAVIDAGKTGAPAPKRRGRPPKAAA